MKNLICRFLSNKNGNIATLFGFLVFPVVIAIGAAVEFGNLGNLKKKIQDAADSGALAAANKLNILTSGSSNAGVESTGNSVANYQLMNEKGVKDVSFSTTVDNQKGIVTVTGSAKIESLFNVLPTTTFDINVVSVAETLNQMPLCMLHTGLDTFFLHNTSNILAVGCHIHSNKDIFVAQNALITAHRIQAFGRVAGPTRPGGQGGSIAIKDPFADMEIKLNTTCPGGNDGIIQTGIRSFRIDDGVHCNKLVVSASSTYTLDEGIHYFLGGLDLGGNAALVGKNVTLVFGDKATIRFFGEARINLSASSKGDYAGFLFVTHRDFKNDIQIQTKNAEKLLGTIYSPGGKLSISTSGKVAEDSAWSVIVTKSISIANQSKLVINKNYAGSGVPVPDGVGNNTGSPRLSR
jgi:Flp pilus assembly protein TadG